MEHRYFVYIAASKKNGVLYIGVTNNLVRRMYEHRSGLIEGFTKKYNLKTLVYYEMFQDIDKAIAREKILKDWHRDWKIRLIENTNPEWKDLFNSILF
ncbi:MAG: GIY-YIG nuclease family protein [Endomicrobia bacterium]|nr:GIY-YIG nuclease family protein [Endomicrobiia bacterium]